MRGRLARLTPFWAARAFALFNLAFLAADIFLAHAANRFAHRAEWVPIAFSLVTPVLLLPGRQLAGRSRLTIGLLLRVRVVRRARRGRVLVLGHACTVAN